MHSTGCYSKETKEKLQEINDLLKQLSETMEDTLILVSADHGLIDVEPKIYLNEYPELMDCFLMPPFIEGRLMSFFIREDLKDVFKERFNQLFSDDFILLTRQEALEKGYLVQVNHIKRLLILSVILLPVQQVQNYLIICQ